MLKKLAWNTFKNTGNINTMMELLEVSHLENYIEKEKITNLQDNQSNIIEIDRITGIEPNNIFNSIQSNKIGNDKTELNKRKK